MSSLTEKILASKKVFFVYLVSLYALWIGKQVSEQYLISLGNRIRLEHLINEVYFLNSQYFVLDLCRFVFAIQFITLIFSLAFKVKKIYEKSERSVLLETIFVSLILLNSTLILFLILIGTFIFAPSKAVILISLIFVFITSSAIAYSLNSDRDEIENTNEVSKNSIWTKLKQFGFPHFREVFAISWALAFFFGMIQRDKLLPQNSFLSWAIIHLLPFLIAVAGIIYLILGLIFKAKKLDELERQIYYERSSIVILILIGMMLSYIMLNTFFQISFEFTDFAIIFGPAMLISELLVRERYS
jgi:hypothetical protein